jgi:hypothetical protein
MTDDYSAEAVLITLPVRKPLKTDYFRASADPDYSADVPVIEWGEGLDRANYLVHPALTATLEGEYRRTRLILCVTKTTTLFLWPIKLPSESGPSGGRGWTESALQIAEMAKEHWVRMKGDVSAGGYQVQKAKGVFAEPKWPTEPLQELLEKAFKDRVVDSPDHFILRELRGEI